MEKENYFSKGFISEFHAIFSDYGVLLILFFALFLYPIAYQFAYKNGNVKEIPVAIFDKDNSNTSRAVVRMIKSSDKIDGKVYETVAQAHEDLRLSKVRSVVIIEKDLEKKVVSGSDQAVVSVYVDGTNLLINKEVLMSVSKSVYTFSAKVEVKKILSKVGSLDQTINFIKPVDFVSLKLFNTKQHYDMYIMPAIILLLLQQTLLVGITIIGGTRRERGLHAKGFRFVDNVLFLLGRSAVYFIVSMINATIVLGLFSLLFSYEFTISMVDFYLLIIPYMLSTIFFGIFLSTLFTQRETPVLFLVFASPLLLFASGVSWPKELIPTFIVTLFTIFPSTTMIPAYNKVAGMGAGLEYVTHEMTILYSLAFVYFLFSSIATYRISKK